MKKYLKRRFRKRGVKKAIGRALVTKRKGAIVSAVTAVNNKINRIAKSMPKANRLYYQTNGSLSLGLTSYNSVNLSRFAGWTRVFGTSTEDEGVRTAHFRNFKVQNYVTIINGITNDAIQPVSFTYFLVKLTKKGSYLLDETTGNLKTLTSGVHYISTSIFGSGGIGGQTLLNKEFFKLISYKKFVLGNQNQALTNGGVQSQSGTDRRWDNRIYLDFDVTNPSGNWRDNLMPQNPQQNIFMILFNDNTLVDRQPRWTYQSLATLDTY